VTTSDPPRPGRDPIRPRALAAGARLALIAPASPYDPAEFAAGRARLERAGYRIGEVAPHRAMGALVAGTVEARLDELHGAFADDDVDGVIAIRGGYGVIQLLDRVDWALLAAHPKPFVGLSDLTPLLTNAWQRAGLVTFHGPMVVGLGGRTEERSVDRLLWALRHPEPLADLPADADADSWCLHPGRAAGRLIGGNLAMLCATLGTPFAVDTVGRILLIEEVGEPLYRVDRMLTQLRLAGALARCAAIGFGEMVGCEPADGVGYSLRDVVRDALAGLEMPVLWGLPFGHGPRNWTFPVGVRAELDADGGKIRFLEPAVDPPRGSTRTAERRT
jgi:muramoyltetrapeptide carboxypeptidase